MIARIRHKGLFVVGVFLSLFMGALMAGAILAPWTPSWLREWILTGLGVLFIVFLMLVVLRYIGLLWLSHLQQTEETTEAMAKGDGAEDDAPLPPVSIIVPAYNEGKVIAKAIRSLMELDYPRFEVLVVDDGSTDGTADMASEMEGEYGPVRVRVVSKENGGKASALNLGISLARYPIVLCMDADSMLSPNTLRVSVPHFQDSKVAAVAGNVKVGNRVNLWTRIQALEYIQGLNIPRRAQSFLQTVNIIPGALGLFRRDVLVELGGYDTDTFAEDADLTLKLLANGWRVLYESRAVAFTEAPEKLTDLLKQRYRWTRGILQALTKYRKLLRQPNRDISVWISLVMMSFEGWIWPFLNVVVHMAFVLAVLMWGTELQVVSWWVLLTVLEGSVALYTVVLEREDLRLVPLAVLYRFFFILLVDVAKVLSAMEESLKIDMDWGKLERAASARSF